MSWKQIFTVGSVMVGGFLYLIYKSQEKILYLNEQVPPKRTSENPNPYKNPGQHYMSYEDVWLTTQDGLKLHAWYIPAPPMTERDDTTTYSYSRAVIHSPDTSDIVSVTDGDTMSNNNEQMLSDTSAPTIIWFHANAGNMGFRLPNLYKMHKELECNLFILSYRGYGESEGEPNEDGIKIDSITAMEYIFDRANSDNNNDDEEDGGIDKNKIFVFGRSLGGAVAGYVASEYDSQLCGLILENTFLSISDMVGKVFPFLNFDIVKQYMLRIHWRTVDLIPNVKCPILFLASEKDEIVPHNQMIELHECAIASSYKLMYKIADGMHNDAWLDEKGGRNYWRIMKQWMQEAVAIKEIQLRKLHKTQMKTNDNDNDSDGIKSEL